MKEYEDFPKNICIRLNRRCNLSCSFCLALRKNEELSTDQVKKSLEWLKDQGITKARLAGGEPTLRSDFMDIIRYSTSLGLKTIVYSNLIDIDSIFDELVQYPVSVTTSIHGNQYFHDFVTQLGAYEATYRNIKRLTANHIYVSLHTVLMKENFYSAEDIIQTAIQAGIKKVSFQTLIPRGKGLELFNQGENENDIVRMLEELVPLQEKYAPDIKIKYINLYEKNYYVLETDGCIYLQKANEANDIFIRRIV